MFALAEEGPPQFRDLRLEFRSREVIQFVADDHVAREAKQSAGALAGVQGFAFVVCDENGDGGVVNDGPKK